MHTNSYKKAKYNTHTHTHTHTLTHSPTSTLTHSHTFTHSLTHSHTSTLTHSHTHSRTHKRPWQLEAVLRHGAVKLLMPHHRPLDTITSVATTTIKAIGTNAIEHALQLQFNLHKRRALVWVVPPASLQQPHV